MYIHIPLYIIIYIYSIYDYIYIYILHIHVSYEFVVCDTSCQHVVVFRLRSSVMVLENRCICLSWEATARACWKGLMVGHLN